MKKVLCFLVFIIIASSLFVVLNYKYDNKEISLISNSNLSINDELKNETDEQLSMFDFSNLDEMLNNEEIASNFGANSFLEKVKSLISGEYSADFVSILKLIFETFFNDLKTLIPTLALVLAVSVLSNFVSEFKVKSGKNVGDIVHFVCYAVVIIIICANITNLIKLAQNTINSMETQMETLFPIILTLMASIGNTVSVGIYQPIIAMLSGIITGVFKYLVIPIFLISFVFSVVGNLSNNVKLNKFSSLLKDVFKWVIGGVFTIFTGIMAVKGISAGSFDGVSIRTTKFAIKTYVPLVGGYLSDGFNIIMGSSILIKNAVGTAGLLLIFLSILSPIITILIFKWAIHLLSAFLEPLMDNKISNFLYSLSSSINMLIASILCVAMMYIICIGLLMTTGNVYWG